MAAFSGKTAKLDDLAYDFTAWLPDTDEELGYTPGVHPITEPPQDAIVAYFGAYASMLRNQAAAAEKFQSRLGVLEGKFASGDITADERYDQSQAIETEYSEWQQTNSARMLTTRRDLLCNVCDGDPSVAVLSKLPGRVFNAFESYIQDELSGKDQRRGTNN